MGGMKYGYARVSTDDQNPALQLAALKKAGCQTVFKDEGLSGATIPEARRAHSASNSRSEPKTCGLPMCAVARAWDCTRHRATSVAILAEHPRYPLAAPRSDAPDPLVRC